MVTKQGAQHRHRRELRSADECCLSPTPTRSCSIDLLHQSMALGGRKSDRPVAIGKRWRSALSAAQERVDPAGLAPDVGERLGA